MNKKGGVGNLIAMVFSILVIIVILTGFMIIAAPWKKFNEEPSGAVVFGENGTEKHLFDYMDDEYSLLREVRFAVTDGKSVDEAILEVGYDA